MQTTKPITPPTPILHLRLALRRKPTGGPVTVSRPFYLERQAFQVLACWRYGGQVFAVERAEVQVWDDHHYPVWLDAGYHLVVDGVRQTGTFHEVEYAWDAAFDLSWITVEGV